MFPLGFFTLMSIGKVKIEIPKKTQKKHPWNADSYETTSVESMVNRKNL